MGTTGLKNGGRDERRRGVATDRCLDGERSDWQAVRLKQKRFHREIVKRGGGNPEAYNTGKTSPSQTYCEEWARTGSVNRRAGNTFKSSTIIDGVAHNGRGPRRKSNGNKFNRIVKDRRRHESTPTGEIAPHQLRMESVTALAQPVRVLKIIGEPFQWTRNSLSMGDCCFMTGYQTRGPYARAYRLDFLVRERVTSIE